MIKNTISFLILILPAIAFAQDSSTNNLPDEKIHFEKKAESGTYQFLISKPGMQFVFTNDILIQVEKLRKENNDVVFQINDSVKVRILPFSEIRKLDFKPVNEIVVEEK